RPRGRRRRVSCRARLRSATGAYPLYVSACAGLRFGLNSDTCFVPERRICEGCNEFPNGSVARGARCGKEACRTVRDDRGGFPACDCVEAEPCLPSKAQRAFCAPFPEGESAPVDPNARLRRRDRPTPEHALPCRKVRSARPHLFDPLACGDLAAPASPPTLLLRGNWRLGECVSAAGSRGFFDTDAYGSALPPEHIGRMHAGPQAVDFVCWVKTFFLAPGSPGMLRQAKRRSVRDVTFPERLPAHHG